MNHDQLMRLTEDMPRKVIQINGRGYLERYYAGEDSEGRQTWYHHFLTNDSERHLHSHPFYARAEILTGGYVEETPLGVNYLHVGSVNHITPDHLHRIVSVQPDTWTKLLVMPHREQRWHFVDEEGNRQQVQASEADWHRRYMPRRYGVNTRVGA